MLKKEILELCLLFILKEQDIYGYEILRLLHEQFEDIQESVIYAYLRGLLKEEAIEMYRGEVSGGPARKYYRITGKGEKKLTCLLRQWHDLTKALQALGIPE